MDGPSLGDKTLNTFLLICQQLAIGSEKAAGLRELGEREEWRGNFKNIASAWKRVKKARLFDMGEDIYEDFYLQSYEHIIETVLGIQVQYGEDGAITPSWGEVFKDLPEEDAHVYLDVVDETSEAMPFPSHMPFDNMILVYGGGIVLDRLQTVVRDYVAASNDGDVTECVLMAHLIGSDGHVVEFSLLKNAGDGHGFAVSVLRDGSEAHWVHPMTLNSWIIPALIGTINDHHTMILEGPKTKVRMKAKKGRKRGTLPPGFIPPPYYVVDLKRNVTQNRIRDQYAPSMPTISSQEGEPTDGGRYSPASFRHDVRGHYVVKVRRGPGDLEDDRRESLLARDYQIWDKGPPDDSIVGDLRSRGIPAKDDGEWMATLKFWRKPSVRGPEDAPYIPKMFRLRDAKEAE